jgi:hypothetical protein
MSFLWRPIFACLVFSPALLFGHASAADDATLQDDLRSEIDSRLAAAGPVSPSALAMFSQANDLSGEYVRNTGVWTRGIDLSGIAVHSGFNSSSGSRQAGTLITPADIVVAEHFKYNVGDQCVFVDNRNVAYHAVVSALLNVIGDLTVEHLTWMKRLPTTLRIMPILPADYRRYCPDHELRNFPVLCTNQYRQVFVQDAAAPPPFMQGAILHIPAREPNRAPFTKPVIVGDSSQPVMAVIRGAAVLLTCNTTAVSGVNYPDSLAEINAALARMGSRWRATAADLRGFPVYD